MSCALLGRVNVESFRLRAEGGLLVSNESSSPVASVSAETRGGVDAFGVDFDASATLGSGPTSFKEDRFRRSFTVSGSSICFDCPLTTRRERFPVLVFFEEARAERDAALGDLEDLDPVRVLAFCLRFVLPPNVPPRSLGPPSGFTSLDSETAILS